VREIPAIEGTVGSTLIRPFEIQIIIVNFDSLTQINFPGNLLFQMGPQVGGSVEKTPT
jgi:hypothetical protein